MAYFFQNMKNKSSALVIWIRVEFYNKNLEGFWWIFFFSGLSAILGAILDKKEKR